MNRNRRTMITAAVLLVGTAAAGVAARGGTRLSPIALPAAVPPPAVGTSFAAPGGGPVSFTGTLDRAAVLRGRDGMARIELVIAAAPDERAPVRRPTDLMVILDRSGSMSGEKMEYARAAVRELLARLGPQDRFGLVTYSDAATSDVALSPAGDDARATWSARIAAIAPDGGTNMSAGIDVALGLVEARREPGRVPHVILISDGLANQGDASPDGLTHRAQRAARGEYTFSTVGVGSDFNEYLMTALADAGTGNYYYVQDPRELGGVFAREFDAARSTVASGLSVRIQPGSGVHVIDAAGYPLETEGDGVVFRPGGLFAGQERRIWLTLSVPHDAVGQYDLGQFALWYADGDEGHILSFSQTPRIACVQGEDEFYAGVDAGAWGRSVVVDSYNKMQEEVARDVKEGRRDAALGRLRAFKDETARMNARVQSAPVAAQLRSADQLEGDVDAAFRGPGQAQQQNELSKASSAAALDARRAGAKK